jgi:hypothetical protein
MGIFHSRMHGGNDLEDRRQVIGERHGMEHRGGAHDCR